MAQQLGESLRQRRLGRGLTLGGLAAKSGVHSSTLSRWEAGIRQPNVQELEAVLEALGLSLAQRREVFQQLEAPRAIERVRAETGAGPPVGGDLLRAMRMRQGLTQAEAATKIGVTQSVLAKWERSEDWPAAERLHALAYALQAHPDEVTALTTRRFWLPEETQERVAPEQWQERIHVAYRWGGHLRDLQILSLEASLWRLAAHNSFAPSLLRLTYAFHMRGLMETERFAEAKGLLQRLQKEATPEEDRETYPQTILFAAYLKGRRDPRGAVQILTEGIRNVRDTEYQSWMLGDLGVYLAQVGHRSQSDKVIRTACQIAGHSEEASTPLFRYRDQAQALLATQRYEAALTALEAAAPLRIWGDADATHLLIETECLLGLGKRAEAQERFHTASQHEAIPSQPRLRAQVDALAQRL